MAQNFMYCSLKIIGDICLYEEDGNITRIIFGTSPNFKAGLAQSESPLLILAKKQLEEYAEGTRKTFCLPIKLRGTDFQLKCWNELLSIPYGHTRSYKEIALAIKCPKGFRAVGLANNRNPIPIIVPCHRVIGSNGKLVGFGGGLSLKESLLYLEANADF